MLTTMWVVIGAGVAVLLVAAVKLKSNALCKGVNIVIKSKSANNIFFIDEKDILDSIASLEYEKPVGEPVSSFNLRSIELKLIKNIWVKKAELFFDNNEVLQVKVTEREPVARVFTTAGTSFYIDTANTMLPLNEKFPARVPAFTDFPSDKSVLSKEDSTLLNNVKNFSLALQQDTFCLALFDQIDITSQRTFEIVPKIGNNIIVFGDASDAAAKFKKIKLFYKDVMTKMGWNYYSVVNVQYKNEIVAKKKGADDTRTDSLRTVQMMQTIAANAEKAANDSLQNMQADIPEDVSIIQQSIQRDDEGNDAVNEKIPWQQPTVNIIPKTATASSKATTTVKPIDKRPTQVPVNKPLKPVKQTPKPKSAIAKPAANPKPVQTTKPVTPKAVMPPKKKTISKPDNDY